jgi:hypothetical protein
VARIEPCGLLADDPAGLRDVWAKVEGMSATTLARARRLPQAKVDERVGGEWSYIETLRHLLFVTDAWVGDIVLEWSAPYDPLGLPPDFVHNGLELGLDLSARPTLGEVVDRRLAHQRVVRDLLSELSPDGLDRPCTKFDGRFTVLGAVQNVVFEEWAHDQYANRDLTALAG